MRRALLLVMLLAAVGCRTPHDVRLSLTPRTALYDAPLTASVRGLDPHETVTATLSLPDHDLHTTWRARATWRADAAGGIDQRLDRLIGSLRPADHQQTAFFPKDAAAFPLTLTLVDGGHRLASATARRQTPESAGLVTTTRLRPTDGGGLYADLVEPTVMPRTTSAVLVFGGSEGGLLSPFDQASLLAAHGHPAMALAYFGEPGLPQSLLRIPLEYFESALSRLTHEPGVDPSRVFVWGTSRGSEAAALLAVHDPTAVSGVVDSVPSSVANGALDGSRSTHPAWTVGGRPVPVGLPLGDPASTARPAARFDFAAFPGRVLAICGGQDQIWASCPYADAIRSEAPDRVKVLRYPGAGHLVGFAVPYLPSSIRTATARDGSHETFGGTNLADAQGDATSWPKLLAFIDGG